MKSRYKPSSYIRYYRFVHLRTIIKNEHWAKPSWTDQKTKSSPVSIPSFTKINLCCKCCSQCISLHSSIISLHEANMSLRPFCCLRRTGVCVLVCKYRLFVQSPNQQSSCSWQPAGHFAVPSLGLPWPSPALVFTPTNFSCLKNGLLESRTKIGGENWAIPKEASILDTYFKTMEDSTLTTEEA